MESINTQLLVPPEKFTGREESFGYEYLSFENVKLHPGTAHEGDTAERELAVVLLGGRCSVASSRGEWRDIGGRAHVFDGRPYTLYLPPHARSRFRPRPDATLRSATQRPKRNTRRG